MLCPYCKNEMEEGVLQSSHAILWSPEKESGAFLPIGEKAFKVSHGFWNGCFVDASFCRQCGILISKLPGESER